MRGPAARTVVSMRTLPSGLLVVLEADPYAATAGVVTVVRGGSTADPAGQEGVAHLVEHLSFQAVDAPAGAAGGAGGAPPAETRQERQVRYAAAVTNGTTSPDFMTFLAFGPPSSLLPLLDLEIARLAQPLAGVDAAAVAAEARTIEAEALLREDPRSDIWSGAQLFSLVFPPPHGYARAVGGSVASRARLTLNEARQYASEVFRAQRMTLLVSAPPGSIDIDAIVRRLPAALAGDARHPVPREAHAAGTIAAGSGPGPVLRRPSSLSTPQLWLAWTLPGGEGAVGVTEELLSRWVQHDLANDQFREANGGIRAVAAGIFPGLRGSALLVRVSLAAGANADAVAQAVTARVATMWARQPMQSETLDRLLATLATEVALNKPSQVTRAVEQARLAAATFPPMVRADIFSDVSAADLGELVREYLQPQRRHAVLLMPTAAAAHPPAASVASQRRDRASRLFDAASAWDPRQVPAAASPVSSVAMKRLPNGLTVIVARRRDAAAAAWLAFRGGYVDADPPLAAEVAARLRPEAVNAPRVGALADRAVVADASIETLEFAPAALPSALALLFQKATLPIAQWPSATALARLADVDGGRDPSVDAANAAHLRALFGSHPVARRVTSDDLPRVTRKAVDRWIRNTYDMRQAALIVVGDVNADEVAAYAAVFAGPVKGAQAAVPPPLSMPPAPVTSREHVTLTLTPRAGSATAVRLGCRLPAMSAADRAPYRMLALAIQERLTAALRFDAGAAYAVGAGYGWMRGGASYLDLSTATDTAALPDVLAAIRRHWRRWSSAGFDVGEVNVARWLYAGELSSSYLTASSVAYHLFNDWNADPAAAGRDTFHEDVFAVGADRLNQLFAVCSGNAVLSLAGDEGAIRRALASAWPDL